MIKRIIFFISLLHFLRHDQREKNHLVTTPWSREKRFSISALRSMRCGHRKRNLIFIALLLWLRYDHEKKYSFLFHCDFHFGNIFLHDLTSIYYTQYVANLSKKFPNDIFPRKDMCNMWNFLGNFNGALHDLRPNIEDCFMRECSERKLNYMHTWIKNILM